MKSLKLIKTKEKEEGEQESWFWGYMNTEDQENK